MNRVPSLCRGHHELVNRLAIFVEQLLDLCAVTANPVVLLVSGAN